MCRTTHSQTQFWTWNFKNGNKSVWVTASFRRLLKAQLLSSTNVPCSMGGVDRSLHVGWIFRLCEYVRQTDCVRQTGLLRPSSLFLRAITLWAFLLHIFCRDLKWQCAFYWAFQVWHFSSFNLAKERKKERKEKKNPIGKAEGLSKKSTCFVLRIRLWEGKSVVTSSSDFYFFMVIKWFRLLSKRT